MTKVKDPVPGLSEISVDASRPDLLYFMKSGEAVVSDTHGRSMEPLLKEGKTKVMIRPLEEEPRIGDILLWWRWDGTFILHRMIDEDEERYILRGDNCVKTNRALKRRVIGIVTDIYRKGKWFPVTDKLYLLYVNAWMKLFPLRRRCMQFKRSFRKRSLKN